MTSTPDVTGLNASTLYGRTYQVTVGTLDVSALRSVFNVKKTLKAEPNTCDLQIYNLGAGNRAYLQSIVGTGIDGTGTAGVAPCSIQAGYLGPGNSLIYAGQVRAVNSVTEGPEIVTSLESGDSEQQIGRNRVNAVMPKSSSQSTALDAIMSALGVGVGNSSQALATLQASGLGNIFSRKALSGNAGYLLTRFCQAGGLEWSVQDGNLQILPIGKAAHGSPVLLSSTSGLVGSPTIDNGGIVTAKALMIPGISPGTVVQISAKNLQGTFRVSQCEYSGDTAYDGQDWYVTITGDKYPS